jgi:uncharacterized protein
MTTAPDAHEEMKLHDRFFIETFTGRKFYFDRIGENDIGIVDIAHALANNCRFTGHTRHFYSVAQHCLLASKYAPPQYALAALLHDASEAYVHDMPSPLKWFLAARGLTVFKELEQDIESALFAYYGVVFDEECAAAVKVVDRRMLSTETRDLMPTKHWEGALDPYADRIEPLGPILPQDLFLERFFQLKNMTSKRFDVV